MFKKRHKHDWSPENMVYPRIRFKDKLLSSFSGKYIAVTLYPYMFVDSELKDCPTWAIKRNLAFHWQIMQHGKLRFYTSFILYYLAGLVRWKHHKPALESIPFFSEASAVMFDQLTSNEIYQICKDDIGAMWCKENSKGLKVVENEGHTVQQD